MSLAFSTDPESSIQTTLSLPVSDSDPIRDVSAVFELKRCSEWIQGNSLTRVALQFPDEYLGYSAAIIQHLQAATHADIVVLADTSYGSCCVDEVAAQHYPADGIIHFGRACLSPVRRLPVLYVFGQKALDVDDCCRQLLEVIPDTHTRLLLIVDVEYHYRIDCLQERLGNHYPYLIIPSLLLPMQDSQQATESTSMNCVTFEKFGRVFSIPEGFKLEDYTVFYVGEENMFFTNLMMNLNKCSYCSYIPSLRTMRWEQQNINKMLMRRYYLVERARDAKIIGILVGTLGVADYLTMLDRLKTLIKQAGKQCYVFAVGKINVAKLANFSEVDVYALIACPENTLLDSSDFYRPVVTPFELELACNPSREWTGQYYTDYRELLPGGEGYKDADSKSSEAQMDVSLITGGVRRIGLAEQEEPLGNASEQTEGGAIVTRDPGGMAVISAAGDHLQERSWQGLDPQLGQTEVTKAVEGGEGIASQYTHEPTC